MFCVAALRTRAKPLRRMAAIPVMWEGQAVIRGPQSLESHGAWGCSRAPFYLLDFIPNPENSKAPDLEVESFFGVAPMRALWFYATAVTAVTMFCTFSLAVTAVTVVTCIYEFMGDSLCTYVHERASWYVRTQRLSVKLHIYAPKSPWTFWGEEAQRND